VVAPWWRTSVQEVVAGAATETERWTSEDTTLTTHAKSRMPPNTSLGGWHDRNSFLYYGLGTSALTDVLMARPGAGLRHPNTTRRAAREATSQVLPRGRTRWRIDANPRPSDARPNAAERETSARSMSLWSCARVRVPWNRAGGRAERRYCKLNPHYMVPSLPMYAPLPSRSLRSLSLSAKIWNTVSSASSPRSVPLNSLDAVMALTRAPSCSARVAAQAPVVYTPHPSPTSVIYPLEPPAATTREGQRERENDTSIVRAQWATYQCPSPTCQASAAGCRNETASEPRALAPGTSPHPPLISHGE
jgi:hypothetical protein